MARLTPYQRQFVKDRLYRFFTADVIAATGGQVHSFVHWLLSPQIPADIRSRRKAGKALNRDTDDILKSLVEDKTIHETLGVDEQPGKLSGPIWTWYPGSPPKLSLFNQTGQSESSNCHSDDARASLQSSLTAVAKALMDRWITPLFHTGHQLNPLPVNPPVLVLGLEALARIDDWKSLYVSPNMFRTHIAPRQPLTLTYQINLTEVYLAVCRIEKRDPKAWSVHNTLKYDRDFPIGPNASFIDTEFDASVAVYLSPFPTLDALAQIHNCQEKLEQAYWVF